jgi:D-beta-D-heptose 7-phosphate kinase/D-beta-D-heptose 1-phosphate adenosyltransferase
LPKQTKLILDILPALSKIDRAKNKIVFTNGCFDLLHKGHLHLLSEAKKKGTILIVGLNTDDSIKTIKGKNRPIENLETRIQKLAEIEDVDYIIPFETTTPLALIKSIQPDVLVKGGDYNIDEIVGKAYAKEIYIVPILLGYSTTKSLEKLK